jgi:hypothetical protein
MHDENNRHASAAARRIRRSVEAAIEQLIALIDSIDGDADFEHGGDLEPSLGALERHPQCIEGTWRYRPCHDRDGAQARWAGGSCDDRENEHDGREPDVDNELSGDEEEPSLGAFDRLANQERAWQQTAGRNWAAHLNSDLEAEPPMA